MKNRTVSSVRSLLIVMFVTILSFAGCTDATNENDTPSEINEPVIELENSYLNRENDYSINYPANWHVVEDVTADIQTFDKVHLSPAGYTNEEFPHLMTIDVSSFNMDQNLELVDLSYETLISQDQQHGTLAVKKLTLKDKSDESISHMYIVDYVGGASIQFILRSDEKDYVDVFDAIWNSLDIRR